MQKAIEAKKFTERESVVEQARTDILGYQAENKGGDLEKSQLKTVLDTYFKDVPTELPNGEELSNLQLETLDKYGTHTIKVSEIYNDNIFSRENTPNWNSIFASVVENPEKYKHQDQVTDTRIAFGTSGNPVNLDLWHITGDDSGYIIQGSVSYGQWGQPTYTPGYLGEIGEDGKISGEIPIYIQSTNNPNKFIPVISLDKTFVNISQLEYAPTIPETVENLSWTFYLCGQLKSVTIPESVTNLGENTFYECMELTNLVIPNSVRTIGAGAFSTCVKLTNLTIPNNVTSIEAGTFRSCIGLTNLTIPNNVTSIGAEAFASCTLANITIPNTITTMGEYAFFNWTSEQTITVQFKENELPDSWSDRWNTECNAQINYLQ